MLKLIIEIEEPGDCDFPVNDVTAYLRHAFNIDAIHFFYVT